MSHELPDAGTVREADRIVADHQGFNGPGTSAGPPSEAIVHPEWDWDTIHSEIQKVFQGLATRIRARVPDASSRPGRTSTRAFALFSYRVFDRLNGDEDDPVVVGISVSPLKDRVQIAGDISGDESGFVYFDEGCTVEVEREPRAVLEHAREIAERLADQESTILEAIRSRHPRAIPR